MTPTPPRLLLALLLLAGSAGGACAQAHVDPNDGLLRQSPAHDGQDLQPARTGDALAARTRPDALGHSVYSPARQAFERARAAYDARNGPGAWALRYGGTVNHDGDKTHD